MALYLSAADVDALLPPAVAIAAVEDACQRIAAEGIMAGPRRLLRADGATVGVAAAADAGSGYAVAAARVAGPDGAGGVSCLFALDGTLVAVVEGGLGRLGAAAASGAAAKELARGGAESIGVIGCGRQARGQLAALRAALPTVARAVAWCPTATHLDAFCEDTGAEAAGSAQEAARCDVVVTATTSRDPVLRGDWLRPGALVCAAGANEPDRRELDAATLSRATFVCCESVEQARAEAGDLVETVAAGVLDWLEVHELHEVVAGDLRGRAADDDVVVFKASGTAAWDVALGVEAVRRARERVIGREL